MPNPDRNQSSSELTDDVHHVSDIGLTVTVSCTEDSINSHAVTSIHNNLGELQGLGEDSEESEEEEEDEGAKHDVKRAEQPDIGRDIVTKGGKERGSGREHLLHPPKTDTKAPKYSQYTPQALAAAWSAVMKDGLSIHMASKVYGIPKSTLHDRVNRNNVFNLEGRPNANKSKILDADTERQMVEHIRLLKSSGYQVSKAEILSLATKLGRIQGTLKKDKTLSHGWITSLEQRWPALMIKEGPHTLKGMNLVFPHNAVAYYDKLKSIMDSGNGSFHRKPHLIFNMEEIAFIYNRKSVPMLLEAKNRSEMICTNNVQASLLICGSAAGHVLPPFYVFKDLDVRGTGMEELAVCSSSTGLIDSSMFKRFLEHHFIENMCLGLRDQVLVLYDHRTHYVDKDLQNWAREWKIILYPHPPHTSYSSQPLDFGWTFPFRHEFNSQCSKHIRDHQDVDNAKLVELSRNAFVNSRTSNLLKQTFEKGGIFPYDTSQLTKEHLLPYTFQTTSSPNSSESNFPSQKEPVKKRRWTTKTESASITPHLSGNVEGLVCKNLEGEDLCCVCGMAEPPMGKEVPDKMVRVHWGQCGKCSHWVHLRYCSVYKSLSARSVFLCQHCTGL